MKLENTLVDFLLILIAVVSIYRGWKSGLLKSAFSLIGFIGGGLLGLIAGTKYLVHVHNIFGKFALFLLFIFRFIQNANRHRQLEPHLLHIDYQ